LHHAARRRYVGKREAPHGYAVICWPVISSCLRRVPNALHQLRRRQPHHWAALTVSCAATTDSKPRRCSTNVLVLPVLKPIQARIRIAQDVACRNGSAVGSNEALLVARWSLPTRSFIGAMSLRLRANGNWDDTARGAIWARPRYCAGHAAMASSGCGVGE